MRFARLAPVFACLLLTSCSNHPEMTTGSYFGAQGDDDCDGITSDADGFLYLACHASSPDFPAPPGIRLGLAGDMDAFVMKVHPVTMEPLWTVRLGGKNWEGALAIRTSPSGEVYVAGFTRSADFPVTPNAMQKQLRGESDAFVAILSREGNVEYATLLGGSAAERCQSLAVDPAGTIFVAISTNSTDFPGASESKHAGGWDVAIARFNPRTLLPLRARYLGGAGDEKDAGLALRSLHGGVFVSGTTESADFPARPQYLRTQLRGKSDGFVANLDPQSLRVLWATYAGGSGEDTIWGLAADSESHLRVTGSTTSDDLPNAESSAQKKRRGGTDAFVSYLIGATGEIVSSYYFGGEGDDSAGFDGTSICIDPRGNIWIAGITASAKLATTSDAIPRSTSALPNQDATDGFVAMFDARSPTLRFATYWSGSGRDLAEGITCNGATGKVYVTGVTWSRDLPVMTGQRSYSGAADVFVAAFSMPQ